MLNDKIKQILIEKNLSPSHFADEIGVQRSSISHILAGRNKPSFDIIQKIVKRFPDLGYEWLMEEEPRGNASSFNQIPSNTKRFKGRPSTTTASVAQAIPAAIHEGKNTHIPLVDTVLNHKNSSNNPEKKVERILIFYSDKTFTEYKPI